MLNFGFVLPNLAFTRLHKSTDANFYPFSEVLIPEDQGGQGGRTSHCVQTIEQSLKKILIKTRPISANHFLLLMLVNCIPTQSVKSCQQDFTSVGSGYGDQQVNTTTEQVLKPCKSGLVLFSTDETRF